MKNLLTRREFVQLMGLLPLVRLGGNRQPERDEADPTPPPKNVLIILFDTFSAQHASLYGYRRQTTPNLARFAEHATVFHKHYASGNFTNPGTASILTGTYPWTHRSLHLQSPMVESCVSKNIFRAFSQSGYYRIAYSHNLMAMTLLYQCLDDLSELIKIRDLCLLDHQLSDKLFFKDYDIALWRERQIRGGSLKPSLPTSWLYFSFDQNRWMRIKKRLEDKYVTLFPRGLPTQHEQLFRLEDAIDWLQLNLPELPQPYLGYFHFSPPHDPYNTRREFIGMFDDSWPLKPKPQSIFATGASEDKLARLGTEYDEYIAYVDAEFGRLYDYLAQAGILDNTYVIVTSDHGEMFERGIWMHVTPALYDPVVRVPLIISKPGQQTREDVYTPTSAVDLMPTLLHATGQTLPDWCEGQVLPTFDGSVEDETRNIFIVEAKSNPKAAPLTKRSIGLVAGRHKLTHYQYTDTEGAEDLYELYDLANDPEERENIYSPNSGLSSDLRAALLDKMTEVNQPYKPK